MDPTEVGTTRVCIQRWITKVVMRVGNLRSYKERISEELPALLQQ